MLITGKQRIGLTQLQADFILSTVEDIFSPLIPTLPRAEPRRSAGLRPLSSERDRARVPGEDGPSLRRLLRGVGRGLINAVAAGAAAMIWMWAVLRSAGY